MTREQIEQKIIDLVHQEPFIPFEVRMSDGEVLIVPHPRLAINHEGAGLIGPEGGIIDIDFAKVRDIGALIPRGQK